ncbi:uncharacterized protein LOC110113334 [Dendrobium catenatum]|uniref:Rab-GAP TBC domain-containing protein n=1 Tax=Dendrobium catenatum TaxID=906689 RepID=A0A2I0VKL9_9ASPA|nr:uncharacterized protein LOC110113334 [Dendrobium catenatum]PKU63913.1 hypothetical protein MA16_Dca009897 [Dendrobium catenatum]
MSSENCGKTMITASEELLPPASVSPDRSSGEGQRFCNVRGVRWRINLGILPSSQSASIEDLRRVAADSRRSYASLRRRLLVDPHTLKDGNRSPDLAMDNPLSQNPESTWGRFFHHAEIEKMVDQDLSRLYPQDGSYFQTSTCQGMLRRILLLWCLRHPEYGYGQGMHELLAPLIYVLHADLDYLSKVRGLYVDCFNDEFDELSYPESGLLSHNTMKKAKSWDLGGNGDFYRGNGPKITCLDDLDPDTRDVYLLSDAYGAEGELGVVISERFMEHDAYSMFNALMSGAHGVVAMADFFSISPSIGYSTGIPPIIEASSALYHLLSVVDSSLHSHLVDLEVEPQYFALRWLRVLFEREFSLNDLLVIWDELFSASNDSCMENDEYQFRVLCSPRGAFIAAMAVSMLLHVRSSLLATENATSCLQRLLNFPRNINVMKLIEKARSFQALALEANMLPGSSSQHCFMKNSSLVASRAGSISPKTPIRILPDSYWEEKWRVLHREETLQKSDLSRGRKIKDLLGKKLGLSRTESDPSPAKKFSGKKQAGSSFRRRLFDDLPQKFESEGDAGHHILPGQESPPLNEDVNNRLFEEPGDPNIRRTSDEPCDLNISRTSECVAENTCLSTENSSLSSMETAPTEGNDGEIESEKSSLSSDSSFGENEDENNLAEEECNSYSENLVPNVVEANASIAKSEQSENAEAVGVPDLKERKSLSGKFQWFWKFGKGNSSEGSSERGANAKTQRSSSFGSGNVCHETSGTSVSDRSYCSDSVKIEAGDKKVMGSLRNLGQSMLENIQAIESVFQQERGQAGNVLGGKGQATAFAALKELRKVSNLLSEM